MYSKATSSCSCYLAITISVWFTKSILCLAVHSGTRYTEIFKVELSNLLHMRQKISLAVGLYTRTQLAIILHACTAICIHTC